MNCTGSIAVGEGHTKHNDRTTKIKDESKKSWDDSLSYRNVVFVNEPIKKVYEELFNDAKEKYNMSQVLKGHPERQIKSYYEKIRRSRQEKEKYEIIIQIGNTDLIEKGSPAELEVQKCLREYYASFERRNPNFKVFQAIEHNDEKMISHLHIQFVPISTGNKRGLGTKVSLSGALKEMGYGRERDSFGKWRAAEHEHLGKIMARHGLTLVKGESELPHMKMAHYKQLQKQIHSDVNRRLDDLWMRRKNDKQWNKKKNKNPLTGKTTVTMSEKEFDAIQRLVFDLQTEISVVGQQMTELSAQKQAEVKMLKDTLSKSNVEKLQMDVALYQTQQQASKQTIDRLESELEHSADRYIQLNQQIDALKTQLENEKKKNETLASVFIELFVAILQLDNKLPGLLNLLQRMVGRSTLEGMRQTYHALVKSSKPSRKMEKKDYDWRP